MQLLTLLQAPQDGHIFRWPTWVGGIIAALVLAALYSLLVAGLMKASTRLAPFVGPLLGSVTVTSIFLGDPTFPGEGGPRWLTYLVLLVLATPIVLAPVYLLRGIRVAGPMSFGRMWRICLMGFVGSLAIAVAVYFLIALGAGLIYRVTVA